MIKEPKNTNEAGPQSGMAYPGAPNVSRSTSPCRS